MIALDSLERLARLPIDDSFGNFLVHYEYKSDPNVEGGNAGFYLRDQWEIQIFKETTTDPHTEGRSIRFTPFRRQLATRPTNGTKWT